MTLSGFIIIASIGGTLVLTFAIYAATIVAWTSFSVFIAYRIWLRSARKAKGRYVPTPGRERLPE